MKLHFGVVDVAYSDPDAKGEATTGEVAEVLERKYHVMRVFVEDNQDRIGAWLAEALAAEVDNLVAGKPSANLHFDLTAAVNGKIEERFRDYLALGEWERISGQTTQAAAQGITSRKKSGKGTPRPAFIDTGLYQAAFRAWLSKN